MEIREQTFIQIIQITIESRITKNDKNFTGYSRGQGLHSDRQAL